MESVLNNFFTNPLYYIGLPVSAIAVLSFLIFLQGFIVGAGYVFGDNGHIGHQNHAEAQVVWGLFLLTAVFVVWECIRFIGSWFGFGTYNVAVGVTMLVIAALWIAVTTLSGGGGGH